MTGLAALLLAAALGGALLVLLIARAAGWRRRRIGMLARPWLIAILLLLTIGLAIEIGSGLTGLDATGWILAGAWLAVSLIAHLADRRASQPHPARVWGARVAHGGIAIALAGVLLSSALAASTQRSLSPGDMVRFNAWTIQLHDVWPAAGENWVGVAAELRASSGDGVVLLKPERRSSFAGPTFARAATIGAGTGVLTASLGSRDGDGRWPITLTWTPLLVLMPFGLVIAALGMIFAMVAPPMMRWRRLRQARLATAWWA